MHSFFDVPMVSGWVRLTSRVRSPQCYSFTTFATFPLDVTWYHIGTAVAVCCVRVFVPRFSCGILTCACVFVFVSVLVFVRVVTTRCPSPSFIITPDASMCRHFQQCVALCAVYFGCLRG